MPRFKKFWSFENCKVCTFWNRQLCPNQTIFCGFVVILAKKEVIFGTTLETGHSPVHLHPLIWPLAWKSFSNCDLVINKLLKKLNSNIEFSFVIYYVIIISIRGMSILFWKLFKSTYIPHHLKGSVLATRSEDKKQICQSFHFWAICLQSSTSYYSFCPQDPLKVLEYST